MPFDATGYTILISSPSDVGKERDTAKAAIHEWTDQNSQHENIALIPICWESNSLPLYGKPPQDILNPRIVDTADVMLVMFWTRLGTKTAVADSGTIEELQRHVTNGKKALIYISNRKIDPSKLDQKQFKRLQTFKKDM